LNPFKLSFVAAIVVVASFTSHSLAGSLDDRWLYAGAFKVDSGSRCIHLSSVEQFNECTSQVFSDEMTKDKNLNEWMALMLNTNPKTLRPCTDKELADARMSKLNDNEIYGCLALKFSYSGIKIEDHFKKFTLLTIKFKQVKDSTLRITQVVPSRRPLALICEEFSWADVEDMVRPYLSDELQTALTMQGQSSEYRVSAAASQALEDSMPEAIKKVLNALIDADC